MKLSRSRIAVILVPALVIGVLVGGWVGSGLFAGPRATPSNPPTTTAARFDVPIGSASPAPAGSPTSVPSADPGLSPAQLPGNPGAGNPGGGNPPGGTPPPGTTPPPTTAGPPPEWGSQLNTTMQITGQYPTGTTVQLGYVYGWLQFGTGGNKFRYSLTFCRQSSFENVYMTIDVNDAYFTSVYPSYTGSASGQPCYSSTGTVSNEHSRAGLREVYLKIYGSTFIGPNVTVFTQDRWFYY